MATFTDVARLKRMLGITTAITRFDDTLTDLQDAVDQIVLDEIGLTTSGLTTYTDYIDVTFGGTSAVALEYKPVSSIVALTISGQLQIIDVDYQLIPDIGVIKFIPLSVVLPTGRNVVEVTYTAGFASVPADLLYAGNLIAVSMFNQQAHLGYKMERSGDYQYQMEGGLGSTIPTLAQRILGKHRRLFARGYRST